MQYTTEQKEKYFENKKAELKNLLDETLKTKLSSKESIKELSDHFKIEGVYNYSFMNTLMVYSQGGTIAQSYKNWEKLGRNVKSKYTEPNKKNIYIWRPRFIKVADEKNNNEDEYLMRGFTLVRVWDISDTIGEDLHYLHNSREVVSIEYNNFKKQIEGLKITVDEDTTGKPRGYATTGRKIVISDMNNNTDKVKTLIHETAHILLGHTKLNEQIGRHEAEVEAEGVSLLVQSYFNMDITLSRAYIDGWNNNGDVRRTKVLTTAEKIIRLLAPKDNIKQQQKVA